jgi:hypothetical protein
LSLLLRLSLLLPGLSDLLLRAMNSHLFPSYIFLC